ncbi:radical SAM protein [Desulfosarcina sp. OttesenSCG-928-B08]|nr:radical SAM protein [Desulfosarcina sp. OttesenSCG-928-B08]
MRTVCHAFSREKQPPARRHLIIPLFIPHQGCPHHCVFCNQRTITGAASEFLSPAAICAQVDRFLSHSRKDPAGIQIAFFGGNFLGLPESRLLQLLQTAAPFVRRGEVHSLRFSTRPDTIFPHTLDLIAPFPVSTVELGIQSMRDTVLEAACRGHRAADTVSAISQIKARGYAVGAQIMVGLPGDDAAGAMETARQLVLLKPDFVRIYPTLVLADSPLASLFSAGRYLPMALDACVTLVKNLFLFFQAHHIPVIRMGLQASDGLSDGRNVLAGPWHPAFGHLVHSEIALDAIESMLKNEMPVSGPLSITVHPTRVSRVQGLNRRNLAILKDRYQVDEIVIHQDESLSPDQIKIGDRSVAELIAGEESGPPAPFDSDAFLAQMRAKHGQ